MNDEKEAKPKFRARLKALISDEHKDLVIQMKEGQLLRVLQPKDILDIHYEHNDPTSPHYNPGEMTVGAVCFVAKFIGFEGLKELEKGEESRNKGKEENQQRVGEFKITLENKIYDLALLSPDILGSPQKILDELYFEEFNRKNQDGTGYTTKGFRDKIREVIPAVQERLERRKETYGNVTDKGKG